MTTNTFDIYSANGITMSDSFVQKGEIRVPFANLTSVIRKKAAPARGFGITLVVIGIVMFLCTLGANAVIFILYTDNPFGGIWAPFLITFCLGTLLVLGGLVAMLVARPGYLIQLNERDASATPKILYKSSKKEELEPVWDALIRAIQQTYQVSTAEQGGSTTVTLIAPLISNTKSADDSAMVTG